VNLSSEKKEELLNACLSLQGALGQRLFEHVAHLNRRSDDNDIREALDEALNRTVVINGETKAAKKIWQEFARTYTRDLRPYEDFGELVSAMRTALAWNDALEDPETPIHRQEMKADLTGISNAIRDLVIELNDH
jgi:hypothetical protein